MEIRKYSNNDKRPVSKLFDRFQDHLVAMDSFDILKRPAGYGEKYLELTLESISKGKGAMYLAVKERKIIGLVVAFIIGRPKDPGANPGIRGRIQELYVEKGHRGEGVGFALMKKAEDYLKRRKCKLVFIEVFTPNKMALEFYKKLGYKSCDIELIKRL